MKKANDISTEQDEYSQNLAAYIQNRFSSMENEKEYMLPVFDKVGEYVNLRHEKQQGEDIKGSFAISKVWDTTAIWAAELAASATVNAIFPTAQRSLVIRPKRFIKDSKDVKEYFQTINKIFCAYLDNPETNLYNSIVEVINDLFIYATSSLFMDIEEDTDFFSEVPVVYRSMSLKSLYIDEGKKGKIDTIYYKFEYTLARLVQEYGLENISPKLRDKYKSQFKSGKFNLDEKIEVIQAIEPAEYFYSNMRKKDKKKYMSIHIEVKTNHILKESGFKDLPVIPVRLQKRSDEIWGRSPAINGLPSILLANIMNEAINMAVEKALDPALVVVNNGILGTDINTSAGALNVISQVGNQISNPVFPLNTVGEIGIAVSVLEQIRISIQKHFYLDWLFDMSAQRERTLGEVNLQNDLRGKAVGALYARIETELILPLVKKTFDILFQSGKLGVFKGDDKHIALQEAGVPESTIFFIPEELKIMKKIKKEGDKVFPSDFYDVVFISPAARARNREEVEGMSEFIRLVAPLSQIPEVTDGVNFSQYVKRLAEILGVDVDLLNSAEVIKQIQEARNQQIQMQTQMQVAEVQSKMNRDKAMADSMTAATVSKLGVGGI